MDNPVAYGLFLALINGAICISIPALVAYTQRKDESRDVETEATAIESGELLSQEAN
ncbi:hypothetical protein [Lyngbya sp. CCY1209]|uniref:hypothetical protein n=1 Tax=Lyngbya sp. CCY1209 TaxID=2886103 RepID=UPI002D20DA48|nr:hypothetical protein [Lyngbya sp. CCY1209]MEB3884589.1 hypothetical protein [Lyngbya sp. CCY1209]